MRHLEMRLLTAVVALGLALPVLAAESKEEKMTSDQTQQQYTRKSITYLGILNAAGAPDDHLAIIESGIRKKIELKRFDYNAVSLGGVYTIDQFVALLKEYVGKRAVDRAAAEAEYEARFKSARVLASDVDRIMTSAYFYDAKVTGFNLSEWVCPTDAKEALKNGCVAGQPYMRSTVNGEVTFYQANLSDDAQPPYKLVKVLKVLPVKADERIQLPAQPTPEGVMAARQAASLTATNKAVSGIAGLGDQLEKQMKQIPEFQLKSPVTAALSDGVEFMMGKGEGVKMDDTYDVTEFDQAGSKKIIGYVKVRKIGDATGSGEGTPSYAEKVKEKKGFVGGEQLFEHPLMGVSAGIHGVLEVALKDLLDPTSEDMGIYPGLGLYVDVDLAKYIGISEFYASLEGDVLFVGSIDTGYDELSVTLIHGMFGLKKKWYLNSLVFTAGLRGGISYYEVDAEDTDTIGFGGDLVLGFEYYIVPEFSVYLKAAGRFFTNPLNVWADDAEAEMGAQVLFGAFLAL